MVDEHPGLELAADRVSNFYPWGMADTIMLDIGNGCYNCQINVLPTGIVEVQ